MTKTSTALFAAGAMLFVALIAWQGFGPVASTLSVAGWGLAVVAAFHLLPLVLDAAAILVVLDRGGRTLGRAIADSVLTRWIGESVNSLLPAGQLGGPVLMVRSLVQLDHPLHDAAAAITVSTTLQALAQLLFALAGFALFAAFASHDSVDALGGPVMIATAVVLALLLAFGFAQRHGLFGRVLRTVSKVFGRRDWSGLTIRADGIDRAVASLYENRRKVVATFGFSLVGWVVGTGEVWLALHFLGHPVDWIDALLLESAGQAIRGAAFAIPGALGAQEGGYLLLAPLVGLPLEAGLALSLAKRAREIALGLPGLVALHRLERNSRRRTAPLPTAPHP